MRVVVVCLVVALLTAPVVVQYTRTASKHKSSAHCSCVAIDNLRVYHSHMQPQPMLFPPSGSALTYVYCLRTGERGSRRLGLHGQ